MRLKPRDGRNVVNPITGIQIEAPFELETLPLNQRVALLRLMADGDLVEDSATDSATKKAAGGAK